MSDEQSEGRPDEQAKQPAPETGGEGGAQQARPADPEREAKIAAAKAMAAKVAAARAGAGAGGGGAAAESTAAAAAATGGAKERPADPEREAKIAAAKAMAAKVAAARAGAGAQAAPVASAAVGAKPAESPDMRMERAEAAARARNLASETGKVSRRTMLRWLMWGSVLAVLGEGAGGALAMFWPDHVTGFGGTVLAGAVGEFSQVNGGPWKITEAHTWMVHVQPGLLALWWRCPHLGCTIPWRKSEGIFHCPCHGSEFQYDGQHIAGPAPKSMWAFPIHVKGGQVYVDTGKPEYRLNYEASDVTKWGYPMKA